MRIDKWLWSIRMYKTRTIAADACKNNRISINGQLVKASREVKVGDVVNIKKMPVVYSFRVIEMLKGRQSAKNVPIYAKNITPQSELDKLNQNVTFTLKRDRGTGRPTKKERREIDTLMSDFSGMEWDDELDSLDDGLDDDITMRGYDDIDDLDDIDDDDLGEGYVKSKKSKSKFDTKPSRKNSDAEDYDFNF